jgi:ferredoxin, 2Fe-2S
MATVRFLNTDDGVVDVEVPLGTTLLEAAVKAEAPEGSACGGVCGCSTCHVHVKEGIALLSEMEDEENDILDKAFDVEASSRLGCQARIEREGLVTLFITRESYETWYNEHPRERHARDERIRLTGSARTRPAADPKP